MPGIRKNPLDMAESVLDRVIGFISPRAEARRRLMRMDLHRIRRSQYAAAKTTRLTGGWMPVDQNVNRVIGASWGPVTARVRQLVRDFPYFARAVNVLCNFTVGQGILFQSKIRTPDGKLDKALNQKIEDAFHFWADECDISGRQHYYEMMDLAKRQDLECGEFILVKKHRADRGRYLPFCLQIYEPDWLTDYGATPAGNNRIERGIEYNEQTGAAVAYHFTDPDGWGKTVRVPAADVIHRFQTIRPSQMRGISPFAPGVLVASDLDSMMNAEIDAAKMASKYLAFVTSDNPYARQQANTTDDDGKKIEEMENAIIEYLRAGEHVEIATNPRPGTNFLPFVKLVLTMLSVTTGVPYELLSGDYSGMNYSQGRTKRNDFIHELRPVSARHVRHFCMPTFIPFMEAAVMAGKIPASDYFTNPLRYLRTEWQPPGMESVDPLRETKARIDEINSGLRSPQEIVKSRGRDLEDVYREIAEAKAMAETLGLEFAEVDTSLANNPAALGRNTGGDNEKATIQLIEKRRSR